MEHADIVKYIVNSLSESTFSKENLLNFLQINKVNITPLGKDNSIICEFYDENYSGIIKTQLTILPETVIMHTTFRNNKNIGKASINIDRKTKKVTFAPKEPLIFSKIKLLKDPQNSLLNEEIFLN